MNAQEKAIDPAALATLTTGTVLVDFSQVHEAAEWLMGHSIWTHQLPALADEIKAAALSQFPGLPTVAPDDWRACRDAVRAQYGATVLTKQGANDPISPLAHLPALATA